MLFSLLFDYHYFTNTFDYGFPTSSTSFFHSLNLGLGECYFADLLFLGLGECYWMEFSLNVYESQQEIGFLVTVGDRHQIL